MQETWVGSLSGQDPLEKEMATHSRILAWRIPWTEEPSRLQSMGSQRDMTERLNNTHTYSPDCLDNRGTDVSLDSKTGNDLKFHY